MAWNSKDRCWEIYFRCEVFHFTVNGEFRKVSFFVGIFGRFCNGRKGIGGIDWWVQSSYYGRCSKFWTPVACQKGLDKQRRSRSDCFWRSSLIRIFPVCYSCMHFVNSTLDNQQIENKKRKVFEIFEHLP